MRVANGIPLGCSLLLPVGTVNCIRTLKAAHLAVNAQQQFTQLTYLDVSFGQLDALSPLRFFPNLDTLVADQNCFRSLSMVLFPL
jgi:hypothetical protein